MAMIKLVVLILLISSARKLFDFTGDNANLIISYLPSGGCSSTP
jgi:hypothetical protein